LTEALRELPTAAENVRDRTEFIITAAWEAFSSPTSIASLEILIATRPCATAVPPSTLPSSQPPSANWASTSVKGSTPGTRWST
jgi:hypothetical protein